MVSMWCRSKNTKMTPSTTPSDSKNPPRLPRLRVIPPFTSKITKMPARHQDYRTKNTKVMYRIRGSIILLLILLPLLLLLLLLLILLLLLVVVAVVVVVVVVVVGETHQKKTFFASKKNFPQKSKKTF